MSYESDGQDLKSKYNYNYNHNQNAQYNQNQNYSQNQEYDSSQPQDQMSSYPSKLNHERKYSYSNSYQLPSQTTITFNPQQNHSHSHSQSQYSIPIPTTKKEKAKTIRSNSSVSKKLLVEKPVKSFFALIPKSWPTRTFLIITLLEAAVNISIEGVLYARYRLQSSIEGDVAKSRALPVFLGIFGLAHGYQFILAVDACHNRNMILILGLLVFNGCFFVYSLIQISEIRAVLGDGVLAGTDQKIPVQVLTATIPAMVGVCEVAFVILSWFISKDFGWQIYKQIGADRDLRKYFLHYQIFVALLKFDFFVFISFCLQLVLVVLQDDQTQKWLTILASPLALLLLIFAWYSLRREWIWGMFTFLTGLLGAMAYFLFKLYIIWTEKNEGYKDVYKSLTVFSSLAIALDLVSMTMCIICLRNFGKGLREAMNRTAAETQRLAAGGGGSASAYITGYNGKHVDMIPLSSSSTVNLGAPRLSID